MIETLILGFLLGAISVGIGATYAMYRYLKKPYGIKQLSDGYEVIAIDRKLDNDKYSYIALKKNGNIISAIKFDKDGIRDIKHDLF